MPPAALLLGLLVIVAAVVAVARGVDVRLALTVAAALSLGTSIGGELLNPGAPELNTIAGRVGVPATECVPRIFPLLLVQLAVALALFWPLCLRAEARAAGGADEPPPAELFRIDPYKALVPLIPLTLLM